MINFSIDKHSILFLCFFLIVGFACSQENEENYIQKITGTTVSLEMIYISGGVFEMGTDKTSWGNSPDEFPKHETKVSAFWMSEVEITWELYNLFVRREIDGIEEVDQKGDEVDINMDAVTGATTPYVDMSFGMGVEGFPAICMTQLAAIRFCQWLSAKTGNFYRLPTEAEWEYACRAGTTTAYSFGDDLSELSNYGWFSGNSEDKTQKVKQLKPNNWGLYDMHGNVAEWTLDQYNAEGYILASGLRTDPLIKGEKTYPKAVRGGSWRDDPISLRSASRMASTKKWKIRDPQIPKSKWWHTDAPFIGFRIVRPLNTPSAKEQNEYWNIESN